MVHNWAPFVAMRRRRSRWHEKWSKLHHPKPLYRLHFIAFDVICFDLIVVRSTVVVSLSDSCQFTSWLELAELCLCGAKVVIASGVRAVIPQHRLDIRIGTSIGKYVGVIQAVSFAWCACTRKQRDQLIFFFLYSNDYMQDCGFR